MQQSDLSQYNNSWYKPGAGAVKRFLWYFINALIFNHAFLPVNALKVFFLRAFGAKIGRGVVIKPSVNIKYPWLLSIGHYTWIGECVWIDNLAQVNIGNHVCISQGAMLLCGNHNYKKRYFDLSVGVINLHDGVWIGAKSVVCPGVTCYSHAVLSLGSVASKDLSEFSVNQGNPAIKMRDRIISAS